MRSWQTANNLRKGAAHMRGHPVVPMTLVQGALVEDAGQIGVLLDGRVVEDEVQLPVQRGVLQANATDALRVHGVHCVEEHQLAARRLANRLLVLLTRTWLQRRVRLVRCHGCFASLGPCYCMWASTIRATAAAFP